MTPESQRIAIAEACGWRRYHEKGGTDKGITDWEGYSPGGEFSLFEDLPDYLSDLNAMHEAEKVAPATVGWMTYAEQLFMVNDSAGYLAPLFHATAAQRAEAFLKAIGRWVD